MLQSIDWSDAAIIGAFLGGGFAIAKEIVALVGRIIEGKLSERRRRRTLKARLAQLYTQIAFDTLRAFEAWQAAIDQLRELGLPLGAQAPPIDFIKYEDPDLLREVVVLADEMPDAVSAFAKIEEAREAVRAAWKGENEKFSGAHFFYSFPRTRRLMWGLADTAISYLESTYKRLPRHPLLVSRGARAAYKSAHGNLSERFSRIAPLERQDVQDEVIVANRRMASLKGGASSARQGG